MLVDLLAALGGHALAQNPRGLLAPKRVTEAIAAESGYPRAGTEMKRNGELWRFSRLHRSKFLDDVVERDHCRVKRLAKPGLDFGDFRTARRTLAGYDAMAMVRKGLVRDIGGRDIRTRPASSPSSSRSPSDRPPRPFATYSNPCNSTPVA